MKVCIAGGGRVGRYLAQSLLANRHEIVIIEPVESQCRMLADMLDIPVICGDSISVDTLRTADVASCDAFVAVTGSDEDNLVACQIAKREFGVDRTVARASNPKNRELLHTLGVDTVVCGTDNLSHILEREIETDTIRQLLSLGGGTASLNEILLPENFLYAGKAIMDIPIPGDTILISITRDTEFIIPHGNTVLLPWDRILCLTQDDTLHLLTLLMGLRYAFLTTLTVLVAIEIFDVGWLGNDMLQGFFSMLQTYGMGESREMIFLVLLCGLCVITALTGSVVFHRYDLTDLQNG